MATKLVQDTSLTAVANAIRVKGEISGTLEFPDGFVTAIQNIPTGGGGETASQKQINFIDYDGTILYSYTSAEWEGVSELPSNPSHSGLTSQGWNWTKAQIDSQLSAMPDGDIWVGQMYITDDGKTRLYVHLEKGRLKPSICICVNGRLIIDWGDGSGTTSISGTSSTSTKEAEHTYSASGDYVITLTVSSGTVTIGGSSSYSFIKKSGASGSDHAVYSNSLQKIEIGSNVAFANYAFQNCFSLEAITMPSSITSSGTYTFKNCYSLKAITIPSGTAIIKDNSFQFCESLKKVAIPSSVTNTNYNAFYDCRSLSAITLPIGMLTIGSGTFSACYSLKKVLVPSTVTSIEDSAFSSCYSLAMMVIPSSVTSIANRAFTDLYGMSEYHFKSTTPPTLGGSSVFTRIRSDCKIYVPANKLSAYQSATNWSDYASYMVGE